VAVAAGVALPAGAVADPFANLGSFGTPNGFQGGQLSFARGVAVNQSGNGAAAGSVYVAEGNPNHRISQFTDSGAFVRAWGFDVIVAARPDSSVPPNDNGTGFEVCDVTAGNVASDCKGGVSGVAAGQLSSPQGIAVDQTNGFLYVTSAGSANRRVDVFSGSGQFAGAFGWGVDTGAAALEFCTAALDRTCQAAAAAGAGGGNLQSLNSSLPSIDPSAAPGSVFVPDVGNARVSRYNTTIAGGVLTGVSFVKAFGWDVVASGPGDDTTAPINELENCVLANGDVCKQGLATPGGGSGQFGPLTNGSPTASAVDSTGAVYVASGPMVTGTCSATNPCRIQKFAPGTASATNFGPTSGPGQIYFEAGVSNVVAALGIAVDPSNDHVFVLRRESSTGYKVLEFDSTGAYIDTHPSGTVLAATSVNNAVGLAVGDGRIYANMGGSGAGRVYMLGPVDPAVVAIEPVVTAGLTASFHGTVEIPAPGAPTFVTKYHFEYSKNGVDWTSVPVPDVNVADGSTGVHSVSQVVTGLDPGTLYSVRLVATTGSTAISGIATFTTDAVGPRVAQAYVQEVTQTEAQLGAHIDPEGLPTTYRFEWGDTPCSANPCTEVPASERQLGDGSSIVVAKEDIGGLSAATSYHYRVVATSFCHPINSSDLTSPSVPCVTEGPDQVFETLNDCGLTDNRCYEMVSPSDKGPVGAAGDFAILGTPLAFQAASESPAIAYSMAYGDSDATAGGEVLYQASRGLTDWTSFQLSPPTLDVPARLGGSDTAFPYMLASDLSCGFYAGAQRLAADAPQEALDTSNSLLYRRNADGSWTTITSLPALNLKGSGTDMAWAYRIIGMSDQPGNRCDRVIFRTPYHYPGVDGAGEYRTYEWHNGVLSNVGEIPGPGGDVVTAVSPGAFTGSGDSSEVDNFAGAVAKDASRLFFQAVRQASSKPAEIGRRGVFARDSGTTAVDVSLSQTAVPNDGHSRYETASGDGEQVFFTARYGLAGNGDIDGPTSCAVSTNGSELNGAGCDLYRYSLADGSLTSVTGMNSNPGGAGIAGIIDVSDDGSHVYFAARGQLVAGKGNTESENLTGNTYSIYLAVGGTPATQPSLRFVGTLSGAPGLRDSYVLANNRTHFTNATWTSKVTGDGSRLLFASGADVTGDNSGGTAEAYLYDADADLTMCLSCRRDRQPSAAPHVAPLPTNGGIANLNTPPVTLTEDGRRVFFFSANRLAYGATEGRANLYQWEDGQISFVASSAPSTTKFSLRFAGASADGDDVYFTTVDQYTWEDTDGKLDVYAARVGGGFPEPPAPPAPCDPLAAAACEGQRTVESAPGAVETSRPGGGDLVAGQRAVFSVAGLTGARRSRLAAGRKVAVVVRVNGPGAISVRGTATIAGLRAAVLSGSMRAQRAGRYRVPVSLSRAAAERLKRSGSLRVALSVRFSAASKGVTRQITLRKARASKRTANNDRRASR